MAMGILVKHLMKQGANSLGIIVEYSIISIKMKNNVLSISFIIFLLIQNLTSIIGQNYVPLLKNNHKYSIYNINESRLDTPNEEYDLAEPTTTENFILLYKKNNSGFNCGLLETSSGKLFLPIVYDDIKIRDGYIWAQGNKTEKDFSDLTIFDFKGNQILYEKNVNNDYLFLNDPDSDEKSYAEKILRTKNGFKVFDKDFKFLFSNNQIKQIKQFGNNLFTFCYYSMLDNIHLQLWGIMDSNGTVKIKPKYRYLRMNDNGLITASYYLSNNVEMGGYLNLKGEVVIPFKYVEPYFFEFENGGAIVSMVGYPNPAQHVINKNGDILINKIFDKSIGGFLSIESYKFGKAHVTRKVGDVYWSNLVDKTGKLIFKKFYKKFECLNQNTFLVLDNDGKIKILNANDKIIYKFINKIEDGGLRIDKDKSLIIFKYPNSQMWEAIDFQGKPVQYLKLSSKYYIKQITNNIIEAEDVQFPTYNSSYFDLNGNRILNEKYDSFKVLSGANFYPNKINNKYIVYQKYIEPEPKSWPYHEYTWFDFRLDSLYVESNLNLFQNK
jgi:hypothetical protein